MAFTPISTIYLCNVPFDNSYKNVVYFEDKTTQQSYFQSKLKKTFSNYLTVRATRADGSLQSSVKVNCNIEALRLLPVNYMYFQNPNHGTRFFYAFITSMKYINEETTEIFFDIDVYQTWLFDVTLLSSYVVREHAETDIIGQNIVPEKFTFEDFKYRKAIADSDNTVLDEWGYLVISSNDISDGGERGIVRSGIYQGLHFFYFPSSQAYEMNQFLDDLEEAQGDCILCISVLPKFCANIDESSGTNYIGVSSKPREYTYNIFTEYEAFESYTPKNNKLYTYPYYSLVVLNHAGQEATYALECFTDNLDIQFKLYGDVCVNSTVTCVPQYYKGIVNNYDCGISISGFPQCSFNSDTFKLWLAKNQYGIGMDLLGGALNIGAGVASMASGAGMGVGALQAVNGATQIMGTFNTIYQASREPNKTNTGSAKNNLLTAMKLNKFDFYYKFIRREHAETIDNFFTMYGYQTNKVKVPNVSSRPCFNYVQTIDCNISGGIPNDDMQKLKSIYDAGVTLWKPNAVIGDYTQDNSAPTTE